MEEFRKQLAMDAFENGEIHLHELPLVLSIVRTLELGEKLVDIIPELEKVVEKSSDLEKLDHASSWVRSRIDELNLST